MKDVFHIEFGVFPERIDQLRRVFVSRRRQKIGQSNHAAFWKDNDQVIPNRKQHLRGNGISIAICKLQNLSWTYLNLRDFYRRIAAGRSGFQIFLDQLTKFQILVEISCLLKC